MVSENHTSHLFSYSGKRNRNSFLPQLGKAAILNFGWQPLLSFFWYANVKRYMRISHL